MLNTRLMPREVKSYPMPASDFYSQTLSQWVRENRILANVALAFLYIVLAQYGNLISGLHHLVSPFWPPFGLVMASVFLGRRILLPGIFTGALLSQYISGNQPIAAAAIACGVTLSALFSFWLLAYITRYKSLLGRIYIPTWIMAASLLAPIVSATVGIFALYLLETTAPNAHFMIVWFTWWMGDAIGAVIIAPVIMTLCPVKISPSWLIRLLLIIVLSGLTFTLIFFEGTSSTPMLFLVFPILLIACHWFGPSGSAWATLGFTLFAISSILTFKEAPVTATFNGNRLLFDFFIFALAATSLTLSTFYRKDYFFFPAILFLIGWTFCGWAHFTLKRNSQELDKVRFIEITREAERSLKHRLNIYIDALRASAGYYMNSEVMTRHEWKEYVAFVNINQHYPGINGLGFIKPFTTSGLKAYVDQVHADGFEEFAIKSVPGVTRPAEEDSIYTHYIVTHIEPLEKNEQALGLDVASERHRRLAADTSRDCGRVTMTSRIELVQDEKCQPGFLIYFPIYKPEHPTTTVAQRREAFVGWAYAPFITTDFLEGILGSRSDQIDFVIYDNPAISRKNVVYSSLSDTSQDSPTDFEHISNLDLVGHVFTLGWTRGSAFQEQQTHSATIATASLALGTCLLVGIVVSLQSTNRRVNSIVDRKTAELLQTNSHLQKEVNDRKHAEAEAEEAKQAAEAANFAKSEFLATMSHEIRTPMNSVIGFSELLASSRLDPDQTLWTSYIRNSGNSLLHIINDILDITKIEAGKLKLESIPFSLSGTINEVVGSFVTIASEKGILLDHFADNKIPPLVMGDPVRFKQIITNLVANALKFTAHGGVKITVHWKGSKTTGVASVEISDTGIGIPQEKLKTLFDKFTQVDGSTTRQYGGTGLGLAICKELTQLMEGGISVNSTLHQGTTVTVRVPFKCPEHKEATVPASDLHSSSDHPQSNSSQLRVLLVDDNLVNQKLGLTILKRLGCNVAVADNGQEAIDKVQESVPSIVFMDCQMPIMDGYDATAKIRALEAIQAIPPPPNADKIIIIALTANASSQDRQLCLQAGMDDYMRKPCSINDFKAMLQTHANIGDL